MSPQELHSIQKQIDDIKANLQIIAERKSKYISETDIDIQLLRDERDLLAKLETLERQVASNSGHTVTSVEATALPVVPCPYRGLEAFEAAHAANYFGREAMIAKLVEKVRETNFVAVVGPSGSGKSSLVRAGLVTALKEQGKLPGSRNWEIVIIRPLDDPLRSFAQMWVDQLATDLSPVKRIAEIRDLADGLKSGKIPIGDVLATLRQKAGHPPRLVVIIDQFEETFTLAGDSEEAKAARRTFLNTLLQAAETQWLTIVFTLRADFYGHILAEERFGKRVDGGLVNVLPMTPEERRAAIEQPALAAGRRFEQGLVARILDDLEHEAGELPLLEFALTELWERATSEGLLTHAAYEEIGEVSGAIAKRAEQTLQSLKPDEQQLVRRIFTRLVRVTQPEENAEDTKRRIALSELEATYQPLVQKLADARLLVTGRDEQSGSETIEVAHEALIRNWRELQSWLNSDREFLLWRQRLRTQVSGWFVSKKDPDALLRGVQLNESEGWSNSRSHDLSEQEREYILASRQQADSETRANEERRLRELKLIEDRAEAERQRAETQEVANLALRRRALWLAGAFVAALFAAGIAYVYYSRATDLLGKEATARQAEANARATAESGSVALATEVAVRTTAEANAKQAAANEATQRNAAEQQSRLAQARYLANQAAFYRSSDSQLALLLAREAISSTYNIDGYTTVEANAALRGLLQPINTPRPTWQGHTYSVLSVAFSADSKMLASGSGDKSVILWDVSGQPIATLLGHTSSVLSVAFSPDGKMLASGSADKSVILWEVSSGNPITTLSGHTSSVRLVAFSPDGKTLASGSDDKSVILWEVSSGKPITTLNGHTASVMSVAFSPDGKMLASGSGDKSVILWEVSSGKPITTLNGHTSPVLSVAFSPDGKVLASGSGDKSVILWEVSSGKPITTLNGHTSSVLSVAFSPDGKMLASGSWDKSVILWEVSSGKPITTLNGHTASVYSVAFSPDGKTLASGSGDKSVILWDVSSGKPITTLNGHTASVMSVAFSPDGKMLASGSWDKSVILWEVSSGNPITTLNGHTSPVLSVAFSPDGKMLASGSADKSVILWEVSSGKPITTLNGHTSSVRSVAFSPDGKMLASGSGDKSVILWEVSRGKPLATFKRHVGPVESIDFSPDGKMLASASVDGSAVLWNVSSGKSITIFNQLTSLVSLDFSPDGKTIAIGDIAKSVVLCDIGSGSVITTLNQTAFVIDLHFSSDGMTLIVGGENRYPLIGNAGTQVGAVSNESFIFLWDMRSTKLIDTVKLQNSMMTTAVNSDAETFASGGADNSVIIWERETEPDRQELVGHQWPTVFAQFDIGGKTLLTADQGGLALLWDVRQGEILRGISLQRLITDNTTGVLKQCEECSIQAIDLSKTKNRLLVANRGGTVQIWASSGLSATTVISAHPGSLIDAKFGPNGDLIATASPDEAIVKIWNAENGRPIHQLKTISGTTQLAFSPNGTQLAAVGFDGYVWLWDLANGQEKVRLSTNGQALRSVLFNQSGDILVAATYEGDIFVWRMPEVNQVAQLETTHTAQIWQLAISPTGDRAATASTDHTIELWDLTGQRRIATLRHDLDVLTVEFSPDGKQLASGSMDGTVRLWEATTGKAIAVLPDLTGAQTLVSWNLDEKTNVATPKVGEKISWITDVTYNPKGDRLASTSMDGSVTLYVINNKELLSLADSQITRDFTCQERVQFLSEKLDCTVESSGTVSQ